MQHAAPAVLGYKKRPLLIEKTSPARVTTSIRSCLAVRNLIGYDSILTSQSSRSVTVLIPFRYNRRSCCSLNVNLISTAPLPSHLPSAPALPSQPRKSKISFGEFSVMWSANVLSCSLSLLIFCENYNFAPFKIVAYLWMFVNEKTIEK